jgi:hypothetical protein
MFTLIGLISMALSTVAIFDIVNSKSRTLGEKVVLIVAVLAFPMIGSIIYLFAFREKN